MTLAAVGMGAVWWNDRGDRHQRGVLPLHQSGPINLNGQWVPWKKSLESFAAHWQMLVAIWLSLGAVVSFSIWSTS